MVQVYSVTGVLRSTERLVTKSNKCQHLVEGTHMNDVYKNVLQAVHSTSSPFQRYVRLNFVSVDGTLQY